MHLFTRNISLKTFLLYLVLLVSLLSFVLGSSLSGYFFRKNMEQSALNTAAALSEQLHIAIVEIMKRGADKETLDNLLEKLHPMSNQPVSIDLVSTKNGTDVLSRAVLTAMQTKQDAISNDGEMLITAHPVTMLPECRECHAATAQGDVIGVITVTQNITPLIHETQKNIFYFMFLLAPIPLVSAYLFSRMFTRRISRSVEQFGNAVKQVTRVEDLATVPFPQKNLRFHELNSVFNDINHLVDTLRTIAADRDLLAFESRLIEKMMITGHVVKYWQDHVLNLLSEINTLVKATVLFSVFRIDNTTYKLHIFWAVPPTDESKEEAVRGIKEKIYGHSRFSNRPALETAHYVLNPELPKEDVTCKECSLHSKSVSMTSPDIAGVVGIALTSDTRGSMRDVVESILTALLNLVGSAKAIGKYTGDLEYFATRDPLTGLLNQRVFRDMLRYERNRAEKYNYEFSLLIVDIDNFTMVNDNYGHAFADRILNHIGEVIHAGLRAGDILARYSGDEFTIILPEAGAEQAYFLADRLRRRVESSPITAETGAPVRVTCTVGVAVFPHHAQSENDIFSVANTVLSRTKKMGKNSVGIPEGSKQTEGLSITEIGMTIMNALETRNIVPYFQPIMHVPTGTITTHEVLMRIKKDDRVLPAGLFIETAEEMGLAQKMDEMVIEEAVKLSLSCSYQGMLFINLSPRALVVRESIERITGIFRRYNVNPERIVFEITERETVKNLSLLSEFVQDLKKRGFKFAIDDFGSGFSSFQYIKHFPIDYLKIEGEFIKNLTTDHADMAFVKSMVTIAKELGITTVAEFIENEEILTKVRELGVDYAQGYHISKPQPTLMNCTISDFQQI